MLGFTIVDGELVRRNGYWGGWYLGGQFCRWLDQHMAVTEIPAPKPSFTPDELGVAQIHRIHLT